VGIRSYCFSLPTEFEFLDERRTQDMIKEIQYFYHTDHLGSSSWITDATGSAYQHMQSLPFGEDFIDQRTSSWTAPYRFTGKERDTETGWDYFGARYYDSDLSVWLSVDPMSEERPSLSPYNFSSWNPVMRIDPDGNLDGWYEDGNNKIVFDKDINSQQDMKDKGIIGEYLGKAGSAIDPETDQYTRYNEDGTKTSKPINLEGVEVHGNGNVNNIKNPSISTNNKNGYIWNDRDLAVWQHLKNANDPISKYVRSQISQGYYPILSAKNFYDIYGYQTGNLIVFKEFLDMMLDVGNETPGRNLKTKYSKKAPTYTPKTEPPSFQKYLNMTKGKYKGGKQGENLKKAWKDYKKIYG